MTFFILSIAAGIVVCAPAFLVLFVLGLADAELAMMASAAARKGKSVPDRVVDTDWVPWRPRPLPCS